MVWQPTGTSVQAESHEVTCGTLRPSMTTNPLLARAELGKVKPSMFNSPDEGHVFGYALPKDPEGAREVTMIWKEHTPSQGKDGRADGKPLLDYKSMNKEAAKRGLSTAKEQPALRATLMTTVTKTSQSKSVTAKLPSDADPRHTYGKPSSHRTADVVRTCGPIEPPVKHLIQGAYQDEWIRTNVVKDHKAAGQGAYIPPVPTRAVLGHAIGAQKYLQPHHAGEEWKMSKFKKVGSKVSAYVNGGLSSSKAVQHSAAEEQYHEHQEQEYAPAQLLTEAL